MDKEQLQKDLEYLTVRHQATQVRLTTPTFEATYTLDSQGTPTLTKLRAITRAYGQTKKYPVATNLSAEETQVMFETLQEEAQAYWAKAYKRIRENQARNTPTEELRAKRREYQRKYREKRRQAEDRLYSKDLRD